MLDLDLGEKGDGTGENSHSDTASARPLGSRDRRRGEVERGGADAHFGSDGIDINTSTSLVDRRPEIALSTEDRRLRQTQSVRVRNFPLDVGNHDLTGARGAELRVGHARLEEEEGEVGVSVSGSVGSDDGGEGLLSIGVGLTVGENVEDSLGESRDGDGEGDVEVVGGYFQWRDDIVSRSERSEEGGAVACGRVGASSSRGRSGG